MAKGAIVVKHATQKKVASDLIGENSLEYGRGVMTNLFPSPIDGLKKVHRRTLWALRKMTPQESVTSISAISKTVEFHPYGDISVYDAIVRLSQPFSNNFPLIEFESDCGTYGGDRAASLRYTKLKLGEFAYDLFLSSIDEKTFNLILSENMSSVEPEHFIPKLPFALLNGNYTIGFGYKSWTIPYQVSGICKAVMEYSLLRSKKVMDHNINPDRFTKYFIPHFPVAGHIRNIKDIIASGVTNKNNVPVIVDGIFEIDKDTVIIRTLPPFSKIDRCDDAIMAAWRNKNTWISKHMVDYKQLSNVQMDAYLMLKFKKSCNIFEAFEHVKRLVNGTGYITPINNYYTNDCMLKLTPFQVIQHWYRERYASILKRKKYVQMSLTKQLGIAEVSLLVCDHSDEVVKIIKNNTEEDGKVKLIERFKLTKAQAHILCNIPLQGLFRTSKEEFQATKNRLTEELNKIRNSYSEIDNEIYSDAKQLGKKYVTTSGTHIPDYKGYVKIDDIGYIQYESEEEIIDILDRFPRCDIDIYEYRIPLKDREIQYVSSMPNPYGIINGTGLFPKIFQAKVYNPIHKNSKYTVCRVGNRISCIDECLFTQDEKIDTLYFAQREVLTFHTTGEIKHTTLDEIPERKSLCAGKKTDITYVAKNNNIWPKVIVSMDEQSNNILKLQLLQKEDTEFIAATIARAVEVLDIIDDFTIDHIYTLPRNCIKNTIIRHIKLTKVSSLFAKNNYVEINVNLKQHKRRQLKRDKRRPEFLTI